MRSSTREINNRPAQGRASRPGDPLHERLEKSRITFHNMDPLSTNLTPDYYAACSVHRIARMVTENFLTIGDYVASLMKEFEGAKSCTVFVSPKNMSLNEAEPLLEHRLTVTRKGEHFAVDERPDSRSFSKEIDMATVECAFMYERPMMFDYQEGLLIEFGDLDMDNDTCDVHALGIEGKESIAIMPFYYRDRAKPSGVVVFEGDLTCAGSELSGFPRSYWSAKAAVASAAQISFMLTHKFDAITILTKVADFNVDFLEGIKGLMDKQVKSLYLVLLDLDDFKKINDRHGYNTGNEVLRKAAEAIKSSVRGEDRVSRWGGEEFAAVLTDVNEVEAKAIAERIRSSMAEIKVLDPTGKEVTVTCSIGISNVGRVVEEITDSEPGNGDTVKTVFEAAFNVSDRCVKEAKRNGKNQIIFPTRQQSMTFL